MNADFFNELLLHPATGNDFTIYIKSEPDAYESALIDGGLLHEPVYEFFCTYLNQVGTKRLLDVGANIGLFALTAAKFGVNTLAIEMMSDNVESLKMSIRRNELINLEVIEAAASDKDGVLKYDGTSAWGAVSENGKSETRCLTLDSLDLRDVGLVKIDIEGSELEALKGARRFLATAKPDVIIECNAWTSGSRGYSQREILKTLIELGYSIYRICDGNNLWTWDVRDYQEVIYCDYFATLRSKKEIKKLLAVSINKPDMRQIRNNILKQANYAPIHSLYHLVTQDQIPKKIRDSEVIKEYLSKIQWTANPDELSILQVGTR
jgi:FkbM family methyltransferase